MKDDSTKEYIEKHISNVRTRIHTMIKVLEKRALLHDRSKLENPEYALWKKMDEEPRYPYGSKEYFDKIERNKEVFNLHYFYNRHHPEHYADGILDMTLIDLLEMLCDWLGYRKDISYAEAETIIKQQMNKYGLTKEDGTYGELELILLNTLKRYFAIFASFTDEPEGVIEELESVEDTMQDLNLKPGSFVDIYA